MTPAAFGGCPPRQGDEFACLKLHQAKLAGLPGVLAACKLVPLTRGTAAEGGRGAYTLPNDLNLPSYFPR